MNLDELIAELQRLRELHGGETLVICGSIHGSGDEVVFEVKAFDRAMANQRNCQRVIFLKTE